ncbi:MAG: FAD-dependent oxidoreductase [Bacteroidales bacterium]|nr:FAD-dependent oxidoreductase [Bacteroidales bacterium]
MTTGPLLVIGGGISGITAAVEAAETGMEVFLVEKQPYLGGRVAHMNRYFPKLCPPQCGLEINFRRIRNNRHIKVYTSATVESISGSAGNFTITLKRSAQHVNDHCTACGDCESVCPVERPDDYRYGQQRTKAIYIPDGIVFPYAYTIDEKVCLKSACAECLRVCKYQAINLYALPESFAREASGIILATGWKPYDASLIGELGFGTDERVVTNVMLERMVDDNFYGIISPAIVSPVIAFAQCAGSRDRNHLPYCSGVCCGTSLKQALMIREKLPQSRIKIFYIDLRVLGRNEDVLAKVQADPGIELIRGKVAAVERHKESLIVGAEDLLENKKIETRVDLLVLATGMVPEQNGLEQVITQADGFVDTRFLPEGFFAVGSAVHPSDVSTSVKEATAAVLKCMQVLRRAGCH